MDTTKNKFFPQNGNWSILYVFAALAARESSMTEDTTAPAPDVRAQRRGQRETGVARRERYFNLMVSGHSCSQIAKMVRTSVATVRREIDRALAERRLDAPESFA
jgi:DNA-binding CsgD family transcriptional regulator